MEIFNAENVVKKFIHTTALDRVSISIPKGSIYGLLGPNGAGKTTLIRIINQITAPDEGSLFFNGKSLHPDHISNIGYLPEESYLYKYLTARETLDFYGRIFGLSRKVRKARIDDLLDMVGLSSMANRQVGTFSTGLYLANRHMNKVIKNEK